jgi:hypothetical protein
MVGALSLRGRASRRLDPAGVPVGSSRYRLGESSLWLLLMETGVGVVFDGPGPAALSSWPPPRCADRPAAR